MELKRKVLNLKFDGGEYKITFPTVKQLRELSQKKDGENDLDMTLRFLDVLGLPTIVSETMEADHIKEIVDHLTAQKKS